ncbi:MAG TPA: hypothetical protein VM639_24460 [Dongiaceae bacterium]|nr:hypothetical protein [Dongiaceae bacterium]
MTDRQHREKTSQLMAIANELSEAAWPVFDRHKLQGGGDVMAIVSLFAANIAIHLVDLNNKDPLLGLSGLQQLIESHAEFLLAIRAEARKRAKL